MEKSVLIEDTMYHRVLRVSAVVFALLLVFESGIVSHTTKQLSMDTHRYLAQTVGMSASVEPTELNTMTAALTKQKKQLDERESALKEREIQVNVRENSDGNQTAVYVLSVIVFILLILIVTNYILDYLRVRDAYMQQTTKTV
jgi:hypothetical protein